MMISSHASVIQLSLTSKHRTDEARMNDETQSLPWLGDKEGFGDAYSKTASDLILSLLVSVKLLHLAHHKFTFLLFRSNYSCLYSHFNFAALAITKLHLQKHQHIFEFVIWIAQANLVPSATMLGKAAVGHVWRMR